MQRQEELGLISELLGLTAEKSAYLDASTAKSPIRRYADPARFAAERRDLFRASPIIAAQSAELGEPNAFLQRRISDLPVLLTRDADGAVHAFLNVCRHRGAQLERDASGCKRVFTCPYHAWSWSNQGELRAIPHQRQGFPDIDRADHGLRRLPAAEKHGFIWLIADPNAVGPLDIDAWIAPLDDDLAWLGMAEHHIVYEETFDLAANWKLLLEGGIEAYHFRVAHKDTIGPYFHDNLSTYQMMGEHIRSVLPRMSLAALAEKPQDDWAIRADANLLYTVFPTTQFLVQQDHFVWMRMEPMAADKTQLRLATLAPKDAPDSDEMRAHWRRNQEITKVTLMEDFVLGEEIQRGFASGANEHHFFGRFEGALDRFNLAVEARLRI